MNNESAKPYRCLACKKETQREGNQFFPFCCERCKLIDLGSWLDGKYVLPDKESPPENSEG